MNEQILTVEKEQKKKEDAWLEIVSTLQRAHQGGKQYWTGNNLCPIFYK